MKTLNCACVVAANAISVAGNALLGSSYNETVENRRVNGGLTYAFLRSIARVTLVAQFFALPLTLSACGKKNNGEKPGVSAAETLPEEENFIYYKIGSGDNLTFIADDFGTTVDKILYYNPKITTASLIRVGDVLCLPVECIIPGDDTKLNGSISMDGVNFTTLKKINEVPTEIIPTETEFEEDELLINDVDTVSIWSDKLSRDGYVKGIDVSNAGQSKMDLNVVLQKNPDIDFVMVRAGYFVYKGAARGLDKKFLEFAKACCDNNKPMGIYYWPSFFNKEEANRETELILDVLAELKEVYGLKLEMPIALDIELEKDGGGTVIERILAGDVDTLEAVETTINRLQEAGYYVSIYIGNNALSSSSKLRQYIESLDVDTWVPKYAHMKDTSISSIPTIPDVSYNGFTGIKQYSQTGVLKGYSGYVDLDLAFVNYPKIMREKCLGGFDEESRSLEMIN